MTAIPELTPEQLSAARSAATAARRARAQLKADLATGTIDFATALERAVSDDVLANLPVVSLLKAMPRVGERRAAEIMTKYDIAANRRVRGLGHRQLAGLKAEFSS